MFCETNALLVHADARTRSIVVLITRRVGIHANSIFYYRENLLQSPFMRDQRNSYCFWNDSTSFIHIFISINFLVRFLQSFLIFFYFSLILFSFFPRSYRVKYFYIFIGVEIFLPSDRYYRIFFRTGERKTCYCDSMIFLMDSLRR